MNLILLTQQQLDGKKTSQQNPTDQFQVELDERQSRHCIRTLQLKPGNNVNIGIVNGSIGHAVCQHISPTSGIVTLLVDPADLQHPPPPPINIHLYLALPRPKMLRRIFRTVAECGIKNLTIINSAKVEKSYWQTPSLSTGNINQYFLEGLEQAKDTALPTVTIEKLFRPFVEDRLSAVVREEGSSVWVAHPYQNDKTLKDIKQALNSTICAKKHLHLVVGPEGGFTPFEIDLLQTNGVCPFSAGERIFRSETFVSWVIGALENG